MKILAIFGLFISILTILSGFVMLNEINSLSSISKNWKHYNVGTFEVKQVREVVRSIGTNKGGVTGIATGIIDGIEYEYTLDWEKNQNWPFKQNYSSYKGKYLKVAYLKYHRRNFEIIKWKKPLDVVPAHVYLNSESLKWGRVLISFLLIVTGLIIIKLSFRLLITSSEQMNPQANQ